MKKEELGPNQFQVNEAWIAIKINDNPIALDEGMFDLYALMDAASTYVIGQSPAPISSDSPSLMHVNEIFQKGWDSKKEWPKKIIISYKHDSSNSFYQAAIARGIDVEYVPASRLKLCLDPLRESFNEYFRGAIQSGPIQ